MTTFQFKMTPQAYYAGWRVLQREQLRQQWLFCALSLLLSGAGLLLYFLVEATPVLPTACGILCSFALLVPINRRQAIMREFSQSPTLSQSFTLRLEEQALQIWGKFEQYTLPWQGITYAAETKKYIILIGCYRMGLFVIDKTQCPPEELNALLSALQEKAPAFGGAK